MQVFKKTEYKGRQHEIMEAALRGCDVLVIAPTGMGKSLCFQVPALAEEHGLTLVVSPLLCESLSRSKVEEDIDVGVALMHDQIRSLKELGVKAEMLSSKTPKSVQNAVRPLSLPSLFRSSTHSPRRSSMIWSLDTLRIDCCISHLKGCRVRRSRRDWSLFIDRGS